MASISTTWNGVTRARPTILMLHGIQQQAHSWDFISLPLSTDYRIIAVDQRGHGDSDWSPDGDYSTDAYVGDVQGLVSTLDLKDFHLIGHSMGGRNSLAWASKNPGMLKSLTIVDTGPETQRRGSDRIQRFRELPDELDTLEEFAQRVMEYTGRTREQTLGALKYSIRQRSDGKMDLEIRQGDSHARFPRAGLDAGTVVGRLAQDRLPGAGGSRRSQ